LLLDLNGRRVVVVGGGVVATRRARDLVKAGADLVIVAPRVTDELVRLAGRNELVIRSRGIEDDDLDGAWLVLVATDDPQVNARVAAIAEAAGTFCVRADNAATGTARTPAVLRRQRVTVAVNAGDDPVQAASLRDAISLALDVGDLKTRPRRPAARGSVALIGGGPGDPELITVKGRRLVASADVVVVDRLAPRDLLVELDDDVEIVDCGKSAHRHNLTQEQINDVLVDRALKGKRVVRLKGGDSYVFGRGLAAGIDVEVVPGVSSALAGPTLAGIPLTHRGLAHDFTVISGHLDPGLPRDGGLDWTALATGPDTLVLLMAMDRLGDIAATLIAHGRPPETPAAVVHQASTPGQRVLRARLDGIGPAAVNAGIGAPSVVVIGLVAALGARPPSN
jgi:uroporphyrin-III C-methyltransferase/precorrin-2 dehydrogenase/sirohydrochlorin ferrochelatase